MKHASLKIPATPLPAIIDSTSLPASAKGCKERKVLEPLGALLPGGDNNDDLFPQSHKKPTLEVFLAYDDLESGLRGKAAIDRLKAQITAELNLHLSVWRFDVLRESSFGEGIFREMAKADVLVLAARAQERLPEALSFWLAEWLGRKCEGPLALVVSLDAACKGSPAATQMLAGLKEAANSARAELFLHFGEATDHMHNTQNSGAGHLDAAQPADKEIAAAIRCAISWITTIPLEGVGVSVCEGCVTLEGTVDSWHQSQTLQELVRHVGGVKAVRNSIRIKEIFEPIDVRQYGMPNCVKQFPEGEFNHANNSIPDERPAH